MKKMQIALLALALLMMLCAGACAQELSIPQATAVPMVSAPGEYQVASPYGTLSVVLRDQPANSYNALAMLAVGQKVSVLSVEGSFYHVQLENGTQGYLAAGEVR